MTAMQQIEQLAIEARAHGMTYGEYVEKMKPKLPKPEGTPKRKEPKTSAEYKRRDEIEVVCRECGKKFTARSIRAKWCKDCKAERHREQSRERERKLAEIRKQKNNS